jgi:hypothetical protein
MKLPIFEPASNPRLPLNRARRSDGPVLAQSVHRCIDQTRRTHGKSALTNVELFFVSVYALDSYVFDGGFDGYFANNDDPDDWADATAGLEAMGHPEAARIVEEAVPVYQAGVVAMLATDEPDPAATKAHLDAMHAFDQRWRALGLDADAILEAFVDRWYPWA